MKLKADEINYREDYLRREYVTKLIRFQYETGIERVIIRFKEKEDYLEGHTLPQVWRIESCKRLRGENPLCIKALADDLLKYLSSTPALSSFGEHKSKGKITIRLNLVVAVGIFATEVGNTIGKIELDTSSLA